MVLLASTAALRAGAGQTAAPNIELLSGRPVGDQDTFRFEQDEDIYLLWTSDETVELHLHGYEWTVTVNPSAPAAMRFTVTMPGRFPVTRHGSSSGEHHAVIYIEIYPQ